QLNAAWTRIGTSGVEVFALAEAILAEHAALATLLQDAEQRPELGAALRDIRVQLAYLFGEKFWTRTPWEWLCQYPRYLGVVRRRLDRLGSADGVQRDTRLINELAAHLARLRIRVEQ